MRLGISMDGTIRKQGIRRTTRRADDGEVSYRIYNLRQALGLSQRAFAARIGTTPPTVCKWEKGKELPSSDTIILFAREFRVSADYLLGLTPDPKPVFLPDPDPDDISEYLVDAPEGLYGAFRASDG